MKMFYEREKIHSSSPSYLVLASIDYAREYFENNGEKIVIKDLVGFAEKVKNCW